MRKSKTDYQRKCKMKTVTFYTNKEDQELYELANSINFQKFVKEQLRKLKQTRNHVFETMANVINEFFHKDGGNDGTIQDK